MQNTFNLELVSYVTNSILDLRLVVTSGIIFCLNFYL
jgi:hypothetical protein